MSTERSMTLRLSEDLYVMLQEAAHVDERSISSAVRIAVREYVGRVLEDSGALDQTADLLRSVRRAS